MAKVKKSGFFDKFKDLFTDELVVEQSPIKKEMIQVEISTPKEIVDDTPLISENELLSKRENLKTPVIFDDKDFITLEKPKEQPRPAYKMQETKKDEPKIFKASPIISPVYGILDKNYHKEDIRVKGQPNNEVHRTSSPITIDDVRLKAFGTLEDDLKNDLFSNNEFELVDDDITQDNIIEQDLFDELDFNLDGILDEEPRHEKKEFELDYVVNIPKDEDMEEIDENKSLFGDLEEDMPEEEEDTTDNNDLFDLIDSMYDKEK